MSDSSQMQHPKTTLPLIKTSGKPETRELCLKFIPFDSSGSIRRHPPLKRETRRHTWGCRSGDRQFASQ
ncbi:hypothetical protein N7489_002352 [Penicillium chrysogenum]|uniref:Uncharacterized protein n=1 Tax=Penicillium chrysogenum TaxID=5076 RepID=A0ABQ8WLB3_PENCH|nr:uncharacterized protein N7489_002352 [Penicillium chrysogenum]XP_061068898.1 uncharacterized protein N7525_008708 [Penicillium rubens]KAJ5248320.1 hypothetical protein N7524_012280 [Penicillium chrysogenum]KAJ5251942.1 hypothetical protein N7489_002352 [Penicillium chrysogenum]KAJ5270847.1 hypothetical protein N7505_006605 [Penicillium chrysogenum]KAJ5830455.1 hypothetical protein N7525_008708 [Penicillium rubens]KAJ5854036.1 hypothetical protein N7534_006579 [Penicillium rubens]